MPIQEGAPLPADLKGTVLEGGAPKPATLNDLVAGKKAVVFGIPGAFTPTCTNDHLPSFVRNKAALKAKSIDAVICIATNDSWVLNAWNQQAGDPAITMFSDGTGNVTKALGLGLNDFGVGYRTARFAMIVHGGTVKALNVEEKAATCTVSSAESILERA